MMRRMMRVVIVVCFLWRAALAETTDNNKEPHYWSDAGYGFLTVVTNVLYIPAKVVYATVGLLTGGLAYCMTVGDTDTAQKVWSPSLGGNYVLTPAMLRGEEEIMFNGPSYAKD